MSRSPFRVAALATTAVIVGAAPLLTAIPASASTVSFSSGSLDWGIKASFRDYLAGPGVGGAIAVNGGASKNSDGTFHFALSKASYDTTTHAVTSSFKGGLHITGHAGLLDISLSDLNVNTSGTTATLTADVSSKQMSGGTFTGQDVALVTFTVGQSTFGGISTPTKLTADGVKTFAGFYAEGSAMDPVKVNLVAAAPPATTAPTSAPTSGPSTKPPTSAPTSAPTSGSTSAPTKAPTSPTTTPATPTGAATTPAASATASASTEPAAGATASTEPTTGAALATTGADGSTLPLALTGTALVLAGGATAFVLRRRRGVRG